jgi:tetratricopeptide (TPR) repeat protein
MSCYDCAGLSRGLVYGPYDPENAWNNGMGVVIFSGGHRMKKYLRTTISGTFIAIVSVWWILSGCAPMPGQPESILDTPEHHTFNGFKLINRSRFDDAQREFERSLQLQPTYSPAHRGMGLVSGMKKHYDPAFESMDLAKDYAKGKEEVALAYVGFMRLHMMKKDAGWMEKVEKNFNRSTSVMEDLPAAYYYLGLAYKNGYRFADSEKALNKVLEINKTLLVQALEQLKVVHKIERARPESEFGKKVALMDRITRADVAGLFLKELRLDQIIEKAQPKRDDTTSGPAGKDSRKGPLWVPPDVETHPLKRDIVTILQLDIQGLRPFSDGTFGPDDPVTLANYAVMIADIIAKVEDDPSLATKYVGSESPFKDVRDNAPYLNALMVCTTKGGIMEAENGIINPMRNVSGADALLVIRKLKEELGIR